MAEVKKRRENRATNSSVRVVQVFRGLNTPVQSQSGRKGEMNYVLDKMERFACFSRSYLASESLQLEIHEGDRHLTAFCDADGKIGSRSTVSWG